MGCLCPKNANSKNPNLNDKLNEEPDPTDQEDLEANHITIGLSKYQDIEKKRKFAEFLISSDYNVYKKHLEEVRQLNDEEFNEFFEGNTDYIFNVKDKSSFKQLVQKFEDHKDLIEEYYNKEEYYNCVLLIWKKNIYHKLKVADSPNEQKEILKNNKIDTEKWDKDFSEYFQISINKKPIKDLAERMKNYIAADYGNFDELIKTVNKCKKEMKKSEDNHCNTILGVNLGTSINNILKQFVPKFLKDIAGEVDKIPSLLKKKEKEKAIDAVESIELTSKQKKDLIDEIKKIYEKSEKEKIDISSFFEDNKEFEQLKALSNKINQDKLFEYTNAPFNLDDIDNDDDEPEAFEPFDFEKLTIEEKANVIFSNEMIKHAVLGLSLCNLTYSIYHCTKTFMDYDKSCKEFNERLESIKKSFEKHQSNVKVMSEDIDEAIEQITKWGQDFNQDLEDVKELIKDIKNAINNVKNERNGTILNFIGSTGGLVIGLFGCYVTEGKDRIEYATSSFANVLALASNAGDMAKQSQILKDYEDYMEKAENLQKDIEKEIDKLRKKFKELSVKHYC